MTLRRSELPSSETVCHSMAYPERSSRALRSGAALLEETGQQGAGVGREQAFLDLQAVV
jgi:hypothetical protein